MGSNTTRARSFRSSMSLPEVLLWRELKGRHSPVRFRRQKQVNGYFLDFYCAAAKLAIEVDGIAHEMGDRAQRDAVRDDIIRGAGIETVRIPATDVLANAQQVAESIVAICWVRCRLAPPSAATRLPPPHELRSQGGSES